MNMVRSKTIKHGMLALCVIVSSLISATVLAQSPVSLQSTAEIERAVKQSDGTTKLVRQIAQTVPPGEVIYFTNKLHNISKKKAENLLLTNPIPANMLLQKAWGDTAAITYSVDGGKNFASADKLSIRDTEGRTRSARNEDYTHVRWILREALPPGQLATLGFQAMVK